LRDSDLRKGDADVAAPQTALELIDRFQRETDATDRLINRPLEKADVDLNHPVLKLCVAGTQAEFKGQIDEVRALYQQAWEAAQDDFDACVAAHFVARDQEQPEDRLYWNRVALDRANAVADNRVQDFYPSLFLSMGHAFDLLGNLAEANRYYDLAAELSVRYQGIGGLGV
jgi:hypothetical protein